MTKTTKTWVRIAAALAAGLAHWTCCSCPNATAPTAAATPTPAPTPTPFVCQTHGLPADYRCSKELPPVFENAVIQAQAQVAKEHPELFDGQGKVFSQQTYTGWVASTLRANGVCAIGGTDDEISVKNSEAFSELYDLVTGDFSVWESYQLTCRPSLF